MKKITFRTFTGGYGISEDYLKLHDFLVESKDVEFTYARLDWMITHRPYLEEENLCKIGMWFEDDRIVAAVLFDTSLDDIYPVVLEGYQSLYPQMLTYAKEHMRRAEKDEFQVYINKNNTDLQDCARQVGLSPIDWEEFVACYDMTEKMESGRLPEGYHIVSLEDEKEYEKYARCLFYGFENDAEGEAFVFNDEICAEFQRALERPLVDLHLKLSVKAPDGSYVAHCGMWYDKKSDFSIIEPVATVPKYRKMGLGKAVVLEGIRRTMVMGAKRAYVGSNQQFYYSIGLKPCKEGCFWREN